MGLSTANPRQSHGETHSKHKQTEKETIVGRKQTEKDSSERTAEGNGGLELVEPPDSQEQFHNDRRLDNGFYRPTMNDAEELCRVMFEATGKAESVETGLDWLRLAKRAKSWSQVRQVLNGKLSSPRNKPQNNAWFRKVLENEFGLSPDSRKLLQAGLKSRYQDAIRNHEPGKPNLKAQGLLEEAARSGIPQSVLLWSIRSAESHGRGGGSRTYGGSWVPERCRPSGRRRCGFSGVSAAIIGAFFAIGPRHE